MICGVIFQFNMKKSIDMLAAPATLRLNDKRCGTYVYGKYLLN